MIDHRSGVPAPPPGAGAPRRFREDEVASILRLAADAESAPPVPTAYDPTLADLMEAARQAGLDPAEVRRAAAVRAHASRGTARVVLGAPDRREVRATLDGASPPADPATTTAAIERILDRTGEVIESDAHGFAWQEHHTGGHTTVSVRRAGAAGRGGALEVRTTAHRAGHYLATWFVALLAWAAASALTPLGALPVVAKALGFVAAPFVLARPFWTRADRRLRLRLEQTVLAVLREAEATTEAEASDKGESTGPGEPDGR
jgi:hypothetical protein